MGGGEEEWEEGKRNGRRGRGRIYSIKSCSVFECGA